MTALLTLERFWFLLVVWVWVLLPHVDFQLVRPVELFAAVLASRLLAPVVFFVLDPKVEDDPRLLVALVPARLGHRASVQLASGRHHVVSLDDVVHRVVLVPSVMQNLLIECFLGPKKTTA